MKDDSTIVVICNGTSIKNVDWAKLSNVDTIGINGSFKLWNDIGWYPTYQYIGRTHPAQWTDGLKEFFEKNTCKKVFLKGNEYPEYANLQNVQPMTFYGYSKFSPDPERWMDSIECDVNAAYRMFERARGSEAADKAIENLNEDLDATLNVYGIFKVMDGKKDNIRESDYNVKPRFIPELMYPTGFDHFNYEAGHSGEVACLISMLLGYKKIILIGADNNFVVNKDGTMRQKSSYGIKDMFYGKKYYLIEDIQCPLCRNTEGLRESIMNQWYHLAELIRFNDLDVKVLNCTKTDNIKAFDVSTPKAELGFNIYK